MSTPSSPWWRRPAIGLVAAFVTAIVAAGEPAAGTGEAPAYQPPVDAPIVDPFRPPTHPYGPGNRGIEYDTEPGTPVTAAGAGTVTFAGPVAGGLHVTVLHPDGVRTTYAFLATVAVVEGRQLAAGDVVGTAGDRLHFSARVGTTYIDPMSLFAGGPPRVRLVPDRADPGAEASARTAARCTRPLPSRSGGHGCGRE